MTCVQWYAVVDIHFTLPMLLLPPDEEHLQPSQLCEIMTVIRMYTALNSVYLCQMM